MPTSTRPPSGFAPTCLASSFTRKVIPFAAGCACVRRSGRTNPTIAATNATIASTRRRMSEPRRWRNCPERRRALYGSLCGNHAARVPCPVRRFAMPPPGHEALLRAIIADPDDTTLRLAYADWLEEHDEAERAEFVRVQCRLANLGFGPIT